MCMMVQKGVGIRSCKFANNVIRAGKYFLTILQFREYVSFSGSQSSEASRESSSTSTLSTTTIMASPVELTHLFLNKDGTLDSSRLFRTQSREELSLMDPSLAPGDSDRLLSATDSVFLSKNNTNFSAHSGSTVILPCSVQKESKFEMVSFQTEFLFLLCNVVD